MFVFLEVSQFDLGGEKKKWVKKKKTVEWCEN